MLTRPANVRAVPPGQIGTDSLSRNRNGAVAPLFATAVAMVRSAGHRLMVADISQAEFRMDMATSGLDDSSGMGK
jgi:hypothetical protein